jgi:HSP20 family molecular chaperone IbpA
MSSEESRETVTQPEMSSLHHTGWNVAGACIEPLHNLFVAATEIVLTIDLPYADQKQVKLTCPADDCVEIYAATTKKITFQDLGVKHRHGEFTCYHARIRIPVPVDEKRISTKFKHGILEVRIPRLK